jgi:hypothetical protein
MSKWRTLSVLVATFGACAAVGCDVIFGLQRAELYQPDAGSGASTTTTSSSGTASSSGTMSTTGCDAAAMCNGVCADTLDMSSDSHNCGRCGHDCLYGACSSGLCQSWTIATNASVMAMAADGKFVAWTDSSNVVHQVPIAPNGTVVTVSQAAAATPGGGPALNGGTLAFGGSDRAYGGPEGGAATPLTSFFTGAYAPGPLALAADGVTTYMVGVTTSSPFSYYLLTCPLVTTNMNFCSPTGLGMSVGPAMQGQNQAIDLLVNGTYAFWILNDSTPTIERYAFESNVLGSLDFTAGYSVALALDTTNLYWVAAPKSTIYSLPQSFTGASNPLAVSEMEIAGLASDGTNVYFGLSNADMGNATLAYVPVIGGEATTLFTSPNGTGLGAESFVVAAGHGVYWADVDQNTYPTVSTIMGIAAP